MSRLYEPTPWARRNLSAADRDEIADGPEVNVDLGYSGGWTCRLSRDGTLLVEVYRQSSAIGAYRHALRLLPEYVRWRDTDVEIVA